MNLHLFLLLLVSILPLSLGNDALEDERISIQGSLLSGERRKRQAGLPCPKLTSHNSEYPSDCSEILQSCDDQSVPSGLYYIQPDGGDVIRVYCDMETDGGGWTVFQRRIDGTIDFYRSWTSYRDGFGNLNTEFWWGNNNLHYLTSQKNYELRVDLINSLGNGYYAKYDKFRIGDEFTEYLLVIGTYSGTAGDSLYYHQRMRFSTYDRDNDPYSSRNCASSDYGAWWFNTCTNAHLNGKYYGYSGTDSVYWASLPGDNDHIQFSEMKVRPV